MTGLSPGRRLLWDSFDATMRERVEHLPFNGEDERKASWMLSGGTSGAGPESTAALARLGYTGLEGGTWMSAGTSGGAMHQRLPSPYVPTRSPTTLGCWPYNSTDRSPCRNDCQAAMADDSSGMCDTLLDCGSATRTVSSSELNALAGVVSGDTSLGFKRGPIIAGTAEQEEALITAAWNLLLQNLDLVKWAVCKVTGKMDSTTERNQLLDRINGRRPWRVTVQVVALDAGSFMSLYGTSTVWVSRGGPFYHYMEMWTNGTDPERLCAALDLAATLLHELTHLAGYTYVDLRETECYHSYLIENAYRWATAQRYNLAATVCCKDLADDSVYGCGKFVYPNFRSCTSRDTGWVASRSLGEWVVDALGVIWNGSRLIVGGLVGLSDKFWELFATVWKAASEAVVEWVTDTAGRVVDLLRGLFGGDDGGSGGGCCYCKCNPCYEYCPSLFLNDCECTPLVAMDSDPMMACQLRCVDGMIEDGTELASDATTAER